MSFNPGQLLSQFNFNILLMFEDYRTVFFYPVSFNFSLSDTSSWWHLNYTIWAETSQESCCILNYCSSTGDTEYEFVPSFVIFEVLSAKKRFFTAKLLLLPKYFGGRLVETIQISYFTSRFSSLFYHQLMLLPWT